MSAPITAFLAVLCTVSPAPSQSNKGAVDGLIRAIRNQPHASGALGDGSALSTAQFLTAAGHSHRFYHAKDGPWAHRALGFLVERRTKDGMFADSAGADPLLTTRWVLDALRIMDPEGYAEEIRIANAQLEKLASRGHRGSLGSAFEEVVERVRRQTGEDSKAWSKQATAAIAEDGLVHSADGTPDLAASVATLVELVALQHAERTQGQEAPAPGKTPPLADFSPAQQKGWDFIAKTFDDGAIQMPTPKGKVPSVELTALGLAALQTKPASLRSKEEAELIGRGLAWLARQQNPDGSFGTSNVNYTTSAAVAALAAAEGDAYQDAMTAAQRYTLGIQHTETRGYTKSDRDYGSIGYGGSERGDLSNLQFALESLRASGLEGEHAAFDKALVFLQRTQNLKEVNDHQARTRNPDDDGKWVDMTSGDDGGGVYYPGNSPAGYVKLADGSVHPRSYGSMTYALLKAYTLCGVGKEDLRVRSAVQWLSQNWSLTENPGADPSMPEKARYQGLFYYYMVMAQALDISGIEQLPADGGKTIDWRKELRAHLEQTQRPDGSWINEQNSRWWEDQPLLCTIYALLALGAC